MLKKERRKGRIVILAEEREIRIPVGESLLGELRENGLDIPVLRNGVGTCGQCRVRLDRGLPAPSRVGYPLFYAVQIEEGWRLSCLHKVEGDAVVYLVIQSEIWGRRNLELGYMCVGDSRCLQPPLVDCSRALVLVVRESSSWYFLRE